MLDYGNALARLFRGSIFLNYEELAAAKVDFEVAMAAREKLDEEYAKLLDARYANLMEYLTA